MTLTQEKFNELMSLEKFIEAKKYLLPGQNEKNSVSVSDVNGYEKFILDVNRKGSFENKCTIQTRYINEGTTIIVCLDINGPEHMNPDGRILSRNHIHIYKEGFEDKYAYDLDEFDWDLFQNIFSLILLFADYCRYNKIKETELPYPVSGVL